MELAELMPLNRRGVTPDWKGVAAREKWTAEAHALFASVMAILDEAYLCELTHQRTSVVGVWSVPHATVQLFDLKRSTERLRREFYAVGWDAALLRWLVAKVFEIVPMRLLVFFVRTLKYLHSKIPAAVDDVRLFDDISPPMSRPGKQKSGSSKRGSLSGRSKTKASVAVSQATTTTATTTTTTTTTTAGSSSSDAVAPADRSDSSGQPQGRKWLVSPELRAWITTHKPRLHRRKSDPDVLKDTSAPTPSTTASQTQTPPTSSSTTPIATPISSALASRCLVVLAPCEYDWDSPQLSRWKRLFQETWEVKKVSMTMSSTDDTVLRKSFNERLSALVKEFPGRKLILVGFGVGVKVVVSASSHKAVAGLICMALSLQSKSLAMESSIVSKDLKQLDVPVAFVVGTEAVKTSIKDLEDTRPSMKCQRQIVPVNGADDTLRVPLNKKVQQRMTQDSIDRHKMAVLNVFILHYILRETGDVQSQITHMMESGKRPAMPTEIPEKLLKLAD